MTDTAKPGTTPPAAGPQAGGSGTEAGGEKLIAGKFKTVEEAVEKGYLGLEQGYHDLGDKVAALTTLIENAVVPAGDPPPVNDGGAGGRSGGEGDPYGRDGGVDVTEFLSNPAKTLDEREEKLEKRLVKSMTSVVTNAMAVGDFKSRNPDLVAHEDLVQVMMKKTDPRKSVATRLENAGKMAREYIVKLKAEGQDPGAKPPGGTNYVEGPRGGQPPVKPTEEPQPEEGEAELAAYIRDRNNQMASHFGSEVK